MKKITKILLCVLCVALLATAAFALTASAEVTLAKTKQLKKNQPSVVAGITAASGTSPVNVQNSGAAGDPAAASKTISVAAGTAVVLDLNGYEVDMVGYTFEVEGTLVVRSGKTGGKIIANDAPFAVLKGENAHLYLGGFENDGKEKPTYDGYLSFEGTLIAESVEGSTGAALDVFGTTFTKTKTDLSLDHGMFVVGVGADLAFTAKKSTFVLSDDDSNMLVNSMFGGAVKSEGVRTATFDECTFTNNYKSSVYLLGSDGSASAPVMNATFTGNNAVGGFIVADDLFYTKIALDKGFRFDCTTNFNVKNLKFIDGDVTLLDRETFFAENDGEDKELYPYILTAENATPGPGPDGPGHEDPPVEEGDLFEIGGTLYADLESAIPTFKAGGDTAKLLRDYELRETIELGVGLIFDLNGHTLTIYTPNTEKGEKFCTPLFRSSAKSTTIISSVPGGKILATGAAVVEAKEPPTAVTFGDGTMNLTVQAAAMARVGGGNYGSINIVVNGGTYICDSTMNGSSEGYPRPIWFNAPAYGGVTNLVASNATFLMNVGMDKQIGIVNTGKTGNSTATFTNCVFAGTNGCAMAASNNNGATANITLTDCVINDNWTLSMNAVDASTRKITLCGGCVFNHDISENTIVFLGEGVTLETVEEPATGEYKFKTIAPTVVTWYFSDGTTLQGTCGIGSIPEISRTFGDFSTSYVALAPLEKGQTEVREFEVVGGISVNFLGSLQIRDTFGMTVYVPTDAFLLLNGKYKHQIEDIVKIEGREYAAITVENIAPDDLFHEIEIELDSPILWSLTEELDPVTFTVRPIDYLLLAEAESMTDVTMKFAAYALQAADVRIAAEIAAIDARLGEIDTALVDAPEDAELLAEKETLTAEKEALEAQRNEIKKVKTNAEIEKPAAPNFGEDAVKEIPDTLETFLGISLDLGAKPGFVLYLDGAFDGKIVASYVDVTGKTVTVEIAEFVTDGDYKVATLRVPAFDAARDFTFTVDGTDEVLVYNVATYIAAVVDGTPSEEDLLLYAFGNFAKAVADYFAPAAPQVS